MASGDDKPPSDACDDTNPRPGRRSCRADKHEQLMAELHAAHQPKAQRTAQATWMPLDKPRNTPSSHRKRINCNHVCPSSCSYQREIGIQKEKVRGSEASDRFS